MIIAGITVSASAPEVFRSNDVSRMSELTAKGDGFMHRGEADSAFAYYSRIIECYNPTLDDAKKRLCARAFNNAGYLSFFHKGNFPQAYSWFLMAEQLAEASLRLADREKFGHLTIEAVGESVGFKSRTWFATTFKKVTGLTPREFQKAAMQSG